MIVRAPLSLLARAIVATWLLCMAALPAQAAKVALVLGNGNYQFADPLRNATNDATDMAARLRELGFTVFDGINLTRVEALRLVQQFAAALTPSDTALFYFAGHGIQINAKNYLLTRSAKVSNPLLIDQDGFELGKILDLIAQNANTTIAMIDACRDNPLAQALVANTEPATRSAWGLSRGLAPLDREYSNSLVAFATSPGRVAYDGAETHSPFTNALLKHIATPGIEVSVLLKRITREVLVATDGAQRPEVVASMAREFYF